jgi:adenylyltransferase/sulfurtransferase
MSGAVSETRFALIGAGGLGGPIAYSLAAAGAGELVLCDHDVVELSNLQRQVQFTTADIDRKKVIVLAEELERRGYPRARLHPVDRRFTAESAPAIIAGADVVLDCSDNFPTKFLVNDQAMVAGVPFVIAGVLRYGGQVLAVRPGRTGGYRCVFEEPPTDELSCAEAGVLGATVAVIAGHAARAAIALAIDADAASDADGELIVFNDLRQTDEPRSVRFQPRSGCTACAGAS